MHTGLYPQTGPETARRVYFRQTSAHDKRTCLLCSTEQSVSCIYAQTLPYRILPVPEKLHPAVHTTSPSSKGRVGFRQPADPLHRNCCGNEEGSYLRRIDSCITQFQAQGPSRTCNGSKKEEKKTCRSTVNFRGARHREGLSPPERVRVSESV